VKYLKLKLKLSAIQQKIALAESFDKDRAKNKNEI
jgi:hypothetical protein